jgi:CRP/FNR family transcriptional regulator, nitrogen oxide reductase regulator
MTSFSSCHFANLPVTSENFTFADLLYFIWLCSQFLEGGAVVGIAGGRDISWRRSKFLAGLSDATRRQLLNRARLRHIAPKTDVIVKGKHPDHIFLLKAGRMRSFIVTDDGREIVLFWRVPGEVLGLVSLLPSPPNYMLNTTAITACDCPVWDHDVIRKLATEHPQIMETGFRLALSHLAAYMKRHVNFVTKSAASRLANQLIRLATSTGKVGNSGITIDITNQELSSLADVGYFTTSRILSKWERDGMLSKKRGGITLLDPESLMAM